MTSKKYESHYNEMHDMYECKYCESTFARKETLKTHRCIPRNRLNFIKTPAGTKVYGVYTKWCQMKGYRSSPREDFIYSQNFRDYVKFTQRATELRILNVDIFLKFAIEKHLIVRSWTNPEVFTAYMHWLDTKAIPTDLVQISLSYILSWSKRENLPPSQFFKNVTDLDLIYLIKNRQMSAWFLLNCSEFVKRMKDADAGIQVLFQYSINLAYWRVKFNHNPQLVNEIKGIVNQLEFS